MLLRKTADAIIAITQPRHAWLAGELARAWGGPRFFVPEPRDALICAATLHDIGWLDWERAPQLDAANGLPLTFDKVEASVHTKLWDTGVDAAAAYGRLPALHVSRHGIAIYDKTFDRSTARPEQAEAVDAFVARQGTLQAAIIASFAGDPATAAWVEPRHLAATRAFILAVDTMSLHLCWGVRQPVSIGDVPSVEGAISLRLVAHADDEVAVDPWPFACDRLVVPIDGKRVTRVRHQDELDRMTRDAPNVIRRVTLVPATIAPGPSGSR